MGLKRKEVHNRLTGRDASESHPITSIKDLDSTLTLQSGKINTLEVTVDSLVITEIDGGDFGDPADGTTFDGGGF